MISESIKASCGGRVPGERGAGTGLAGASVVARGGFAVG